MSKKEILLISACLMGLPCRYDGKSQPVSKEMKKILKKFHVILVCPEELGGLSTPRDKAEIQKNGKVLDIKGNDVTDYFNQGALNTLEICQKLNIKKAILKSKSPSCGTKQIYNGSFSSTLINGMGICAQTLKNNNIKLFNENEINLLL